MKRLPFLVLVFILGCSLYSQERGAIMGIIADGQSKQPIPFASIALFKEKRSLPVGTVSDESGNFRISDLEKGNYSVIVSFIGYKTDTIKGVLVSKTSKVYDLGTIFIFPSNIELNEVEVSAMARTVVSRIDKKTYRATDFVTAKGGTATDVLNKLPSVSVAPDGEVSVRGTTDFMVYLNGKPTQMEPSMLLAQISADAIESIDVISVPSAKYDAQGKGGIINITTKTKVNNGLAVSVNADYGAAPWGHKTDRYSDYSMKDDRYGGGFNLRYGQEKLTLQGGFNYHYKNVNGKRTGDARILNSSNGSYKHMVASGERPEWYEYYSANAGVEYNISNASQLAVSYFYGNRTEGRSAFYVYHNFYGDKEKEPIPGIAQQNEWVYNPNTDNRYGNFHSASVDYLYKWNEQSTINASFLYEHSELSRELDNFNYQYHPSADDFSDILLHFNQTDDTPLNAYRLTINYSKGMNNGHQIEMGLQPQFFNINGGFSYDTLGINTGTLGDYTALENAIDLNRGVYAGYVDYAGSLESLSFKLGLRVEYTNQKMDIENPDYFTIFDRVTKSVYKINEFDWFPTIHAIYNINTNDKLSLAASRRISRPPIKNMAPFLYRRHLEVYVVGDPDLKPEYITNLELGWETNIGRQKFNISGFYRGVEDAIFRVNTIYPAEMVLIRSYTNSGNTKSLGTELNANVEIGKMLKLFFGGTLYNYHVQGDIFGYREDNRSTNWSLKTNASIILSEQMKFTFDYDMRSATVTPQGKNDMFKMANAAWSYSPRGLENINVTAKLMDVLGTNISGLDTRAFSANGQQIFFQETVYTRQGPVAEVSISYAFNSEKLKKSRKTVGDSEF